jgi:hypothetical protein
VQATSVCTSLPERPFGRRLYVLPPPRMMKHG